MQKKSMPKLELALEQLKQLTAVEASLAAGGGSTRTCGVDEDTR